MNAEQLRTYVIRPTLQQIDLWSEAAEILLLGTVAHESKCGEYLHQVGGPGAGHLPDRASHPLRCVGKLPALQKRPDAEDPGHGPGDAAAANTWRVGIRVRRHADHGPGLRHRDCPCDLPARAHAAARGRRSTRFGEILEKILQHSVGQGHAGKVVGRLQHRSGG